MNDWDGDVVIEGNSRIRRGFIYDELVACGLDKVNPDDDEEIGKVIYRALSSLEATGLFENVQAHLVPKGNLSDSENKAMRRMARRYNGAQRPVNPLILRVEVKEKGVPFLEMGTYTRTKGSQSTSPLQEVEFKVDGALRSPLGYGEWGQATFATSRLGTRDLSINFRLPHIGKSWSVLNLKAMANEEDKSYYQSFRLLSKVVSAELASRSGIHQFEWSWMNRDEIPRGFQQSSFSGKEEKDTESAGHAKEAKDATGGILESLSASTKMAFKYTGTLWDTRDTASDPTEGSLVQGTAELSLPPGTAQFLKSDVKVQAHRRIGPSILGQTGLVASLAGNLGVVMPLGLLTPLFTRYSKTEKRIPEHEPNLHIPVADRYTLGGPLSLRGFDMHGVGPRSFRGREHHLQTHGSNPYGKPSGFAAPVGDSLGGVGAASGLALLSFPLPFRDMADKLGGVRAFAFANVGSVASTMYWAHYYCRMLDTGSNDHHGHMPPFWGPPRASVGGGISVAFAPSARLELTYSIPLLKADHDSTRGFQIGLGLTVN